MNKYEADYKEQYSHTNGKIVTAKTKIAYAINDEWIYSMHWKHETWIKQGKMDLEKRLSRVEQDYNLLKQASELLYSIEEEIT